MPYTIRKQSCKQSDGDKGSYVLSYTDKKGKKHRNCHTSKKKARGQIAAIEAEGVENNQTAKITLSELRKIIQEQILNEITPQTTLGDKGVEDYLMQIAVSNDTELSKIAQDIKSRFKFVAPHLMSKLDAINPKNVAGLKQALTDFLTAEEPSVEPTKEFTKYIAGYQKGLNESSLRMLTNLIREFVLAEVKKAAKTKKLATKGNDRDGDGDADFADVMIARMKKGGLSDEEAYEKSRKFDDK